MLYNPPYAISKCDTVRQFIYKALKKFIYTENPYGGSYLSNFTLPFMFLHEKESTDPNLPLLEDSTKFVQSQTRSFQFRRETLYQFVCGIQFITLVLLVCLFTFLEPHSRNHASSDVLETNRDDSPSLASSFLKYEKQKAWKELETPWNWPPSPELDSEWSRILTAQNLRITPEEMRLMGENTTHRVMLTDGDYVGMLGVWHHLHCLDHLRRTLHSDYYDKSAIKNLLPTYNTKHSDHCIETLRRAIMCRADTALYSAEWIKGSTELENRAIRSNTEIKCVNWESLDSWARKRALAPGLVRLRPGPYETVHDNE